MFGCVCLAAFPGKQAGSVDAQSPAWLSHFGIPKLPRYKRRTYLEGHGDLVSRLIMEIIGVIIWLIGVINRLTKSP